MAEPLSCQLVYSVGNHLIDVHVCLCAGARLPYHQREVLFQLPGCNLFCGLLDQSALFFCHFLRDKLPVGSRCRFFQNSECPDDLLRHCLVPYPDGEVDAASLRLSSPIFLRRNSYLTHGIMLNPNFHLPPPCPYFPKIIT